MKRSTAREIAVHISFEMAINDLPTDELLSDFFDREHYETLADDDELYTEYPNKKQMEYIERLPRRCRDARSLTIHRKRYARDWKVREYARRSAISASRLGSLYAGYPERSL